MFAYIKGQVVDKATNYIVIDVNGVGYKIFMSQTAIDSIKELGEVYKVYTYYYVREENISLYGFLNNEELRMFELLLSVSGIGAKSALAILSEITPSSFALAVITNDTSKLVKIPGIGKKTAARMILELKDKLKTEQAIVEDEKIEKTVVQDNKDSEVMAALQVLGYTNKEIEKAIEQIDISEMQIEDIIRKALKLLSK